MVPSVGRVVERGLALAGELERCRNHVAGSDEVHTVSMTSYARHAREFTARSKLARATFRRRQAVVVPMGMGTTTAGIRTPPE